MRSSPVKSRGFTLVEVTVYVAIFSIFFVVAIGFYWKMSGVQTRSMVLREVKENAAQTLLAFSDSVRNAEDINQAGSMFGSTLGTLSLTESSGNVVLDIYVKDVTVGGIVTTIRKARLIRAGAFYDLTSDVVNVERFRFTDLSQPGTPDAVYLELSLAYVNPGGDPQYAFEMSANESAVIRKTL